MISSSLLLGQNNEYILFKTAIAIAEMGLNVWFITPKSFCSIPENITPPDKEILKLITFLYLADEKSLLQHLCSVHVWQKIPCCIIINSFEHYCRLNGSRYDSTFCAFLICNMIDAAATCAYKHSRKSCLLVASNAINMFDANDLKTFNDLYFDNVLISNKEDNMIIKTITDNFINDIT